jgi:hypothetical protein
MDRVLQVHTSGSTLEGTHTIAVTATIPGHSWTTQLELEIVACEPLEPGSHTQALTEDTLTTIITAGKPDYARGLLVPLQICDTAHPQTLRITVESATSEADTPLDEPPSFYVFRSLVWPAPDHIDTHTWSRNAEREPIVNAGWSLEGAVSPGLYLLVFEHDRYADVLDPRESKDILKSVTYRVEIGATP